MKLLLLLVAVIAVFTVDSRDFSDEHQDLASTNQLRQLEETTIDVGFDDIAHIELNGQERNGQHGSELRRSKCKARNACVVMGGFCVTNSTLCGGRLVDEGCKGSGCQCCVPDPVNTCMAEEQENSTLYQRVNSCENSIKTTINEGNDNVTRGIEIKIHTLEVELATMKRSLISQLDQIMANVTHLLHNQACPPGFFKTNGSSQCFVFFKNTARNWTSAKSKCLSEGLIAAQPKNIVSLRRYLVNTYGNYNAWLGAQGTGSQFRWQHGNQLISNTNPSWWPNDPGNQVSSSYCLLLLSNSGNMNTNPTKPYHAVSCSSNNYALCELV